MSLDESIKTKIIGIVETLLPEAKVILYGSRARKSQKKFSDIDIALDVGHEIDHKVIAEIMNVLDALLIPYKIDVVDLHSISDELRENITREGIVWKN